MTGLLTMTTYSEDHACAWCQEPRINRANVAGKRKRQLHYFCCPEHYDLYRTSWPVLCLNCEQVAPDVQDSIFYWCNLDCYEQWLMTVNKCPTHRSRPVLCVTTGQKFHSMVQAAFFFGIPISTLRNTIYKGTKLLPRRNRDGILILPPLEFKFMEK